MTSCCPFLVGAQGIVQAGLPAVWTRQREVPGPELDPTANVPRYVPCSLRTLVVGGSFVLAYVRVSGFDQT